MFSNPRVRQGARHHRQVVVRCQHNNASHTSHCERQRSDRSSARTAHASLPDAQTRSRPVIVKFATTHVRDVVIRARRRLRESGDGATVYVNEDVTCRRAALAKKTRQLKMSRKIYDCWTFTGKVIVKKAVDGVVKEIRPDFDLTGYWTGDADWLPTTWILWYQHFLFYFCIHKSVLPIHSFVNWTIAMFRCS